MELNTIQTEGTWNDIAERLNDNFRKILLAIQNGAGGGEGDDGDSKIVTIDLDPSKLVQGEEVELTQEQRETLYLAREGYTVFTTGYMEENKSTQPWGQVISCIETYLGSSVRVNTVTIIRREENDIIFNAGNGLIIYTIDIFDDYNGYTYNRVTSIIRLSDINNKADGTITEIQANGTSIATSGVANIPAASASRYGVTKLSSSYTSTSTSLAATPYAVNKVYAKVQEKQDAETGKGLSTNDYTTEDKTKLAGIADGAEVNVQSDWNVTDASSDAYIKNKPTIPSAVTESTVLRWGFTKNTGTYSKPSGGIPKTDLASAVQTSLDKADTALQSYTEQYKGTVTGVKVNGSTKSPSSGTVDIGNVVTSVKVNGSTYIPSLNGVVDLGSISSEGGGGELNVVAISLDVTKLTVGSYVTITREQYDQLLLTRKGYPVVIADANFSGNYAYESEWGQVISCYRQYFGSSAFMYRLSVIHHDGYMASNTPNTQIYTMEVMDNVTGGGGATSYLYVRAIKNLY